MSTVRKKRARILSSDSDDVDQGNPKTHENGEIGGKSQNLGKSKGGDTENVVKSNTCLVCDGKDNWVLVCYGEECPIAIHQSCASDEPDFDEFGNFYCPYCWYKRLLHLEKKLMVSDKSRKGCRESLGGVDLGFIMEKEAGGVENLVEVNVSGGRTRTLASGNLSGNIREVDGLNSKCMVMEKNQIMQEVAAQAHSRGNSKGDDADVDEGRQQRGRLSEINHETLDVCNVNAGEGRKGKARGTEKQHGKAQARNSDVGEERKKHRRCDDINHETAQAHSIDVVAETRNPRRYSRQNQQTKRVAGTHEQDVVINDQGTQARDSDLGEGRSGQGCCHGNNLQKKASSTESYELEVPRTDNRVSCGSGLREVRYRQGRHIEKNRHNEIVVTETQEKEVSKDGERKSERGVERGRTITSDNSSGNRRAVDESNKKCIVMEKSRKIKEVAAETHSRENSKADDTDLDTGRKQRGRFNEKNHETLDVFVSNPDEAHEERKGRARGSEKTHEKVQVCNSDVGGERKPHRGCDDINHETAQAHRFVVGVKTRETRRYSEKNQQNKIVAGTHEQAVFINDKGTQACDSDLGEGRSGQEYFHENNQQKKVSSTERCDPRTDKRVSDGCGLREGRDREGRHIEKNQHTETIETETLGKEVFKDRKRKRERRAERDGDEFYMAENQDRQYQPDMRNDDVAFNKQATCFSTDEQEERKSVSSISSPESTNNVKDPNVDSQELALIIHPKAGVQERPIEARRICSVSSKKPSFQPAKYGHNSYLEKNGTASNDPGQRKVVRCSAKKRKRLFWTQAEEEMLRVGLQKFPGERNIPWRKILEFGRDVFHDERAPSDLKDKWKTLNKMPSDTGKWVNLSTEKQPNYYVSEISSE
ncbi:Homeobox-like domain superfamily [Arabidopsis thaliana x Arabidopsis arenosa]|uniref:Homeobox-like domain superfamily n=1 Tax=Arabidopsis thaliana x Arabidopsis arenosa TaxID=1240361 RepID=A0A8T1YCJ3_9BRAS|nr:Homeobox-like domain superfamily [Arabidopsis thaliana x Arabidopsis arenosa]